MRAIIKIILVFAFSFAFFIAVGVLLLATGAIKPVAAEQPQATTRNGETVIFGMTQSERRERRRLADIAAFKARDNSDRARVLCGFARGLEPSLDWPVTKSDAGYTVGRLCKVRYTADGLELEVR